MSAWGELVHNVDGAACGSVGHKVIHSPSPPVAHRLGSIALQWQNGMMITVKVNLCFPHFPVLQNISQPPHARLKHGKIIWMFLGNSHVCFQSPSGLPHRHPPHLPTALIIPGSRTPACLYSASGRFNCLDPKHGNSLH